MIPVSDKWKEYAQNNHLFHIRAEMSKVSPGGGTWMVVFTEDKIMADSAKVYCSTSANGQFNIGEVVTNAFEMAVLEKGLPYDANQAKLKVYFGIEYEDGTSEYIQRGVYKVNLPDAWGEVITITAYDSMDMMNKYYIGKKANGDDITFPVKAKTLMEYLCDFCGVRYNSKSWQLPNINIDKFEYPETTTCKQVLGWVLQCCGGYARMTPDDYITCRWYNYVDSWESDLDENGGTFSPWNTVSTMDGGLMWEDTESYDEKGMERSEWEFNDTSSVSINRQGIRITGIRAYAPSDGDEEVYADAGIDTYMISLRDNPMINKRNMRLIAETVYSQCKDMQFRIFDASVWGSPDIEAGDWCVLTNIKGTKYHTFITDLQYSIAGLANISLSAETPEEASLDMGSAQTQLVAQSSKAAYNYIITKKITADAIHGGTLTLGGLNNTAGALRVLDANGNQIGSWDSTGAEIIGKLYMTGGSMKIETTKGDYDFIDLRYAQEGYATRTLMDTGGIHCTMETDSSVIASHDARGVAVASEDNVFASFGGTSYGEMYLSSANGTLNIKALGSTGNITCVSLTQTSKADSKENIVAFEDRGKPTKRLLKSAPTTALDLVTNTDIYEFNYKDVEDDKKHYGVIIDGEYKCCDEIKAEDGVDTYSMVSVLWQAVKELTAEVRGNNENDNNSDTGNEAGDSRDTEQQQSTV